MQRNMTLCVLLYHEKHDQLEKNLMAYVEKEANTVNKNLNIISTICVIIKYYILQSSSIIKKPPICIFPYCFQLKFWKEETKSSYSQIFTVILVR